MRYYCDFCDKSLAKLTEKGRVQHNHGDDHRAAFERWYLKKLASGEIPVTPETAHLLPVAVRMTGVRPPMPPGPGMAMGGMPPMPPMGGPMMPPGMMPPMGAMPGMGMMPPGMGMPPHPGMPGPGGMPPRGMMMYPPQAPPMFPPGGPPPHMARAPPSAGPQ